MGPYCMKNTALSYFLVTFMLGLLSFAPTAYGDFSDVTTAAIGTSAFAAASPSWADFNNDGLVDIGAGYHPMRNNGNGGGSQYTFTNVGGIPENDHGIFGDYDKDGDVDYFMTGVGRVYENNGGNFTLQQQFTGLPPNGEGAAWLDINGDTYLDIYLGAHESPTFVHHSDQVWLNNQNGTFTKQATFNPPTGAAYGVTTADWDQDGDVDVYVSNYRLQNNFLWRNDGSGNFTNVAFSHSAHGGQGHSVGSAFGDFNNDGLIDLFAGNFAHSGQPESRFLINRGPDFDYQFLDADTDNNGKPGNQAGVAYVESYASPTFGDIDNDGDLDLFFSTVYQENSRLWRNQFVETGNLTFTDITTDWNINTIIGNAQTTFGAFGDYNEDGFLDLLSANKLLENDGTHNGASLAGNHWLKVNLVGNPHFDATAIGTQVRIAVPGLGTLTRQVEGAVGAQGNQNDHDLHFGLGTHSGPVQLEIMWPNGFTEFVGVSSLDQMVTISPSFSDDAWSNTSGGSWTDASNWFGGVVPNGNADMAQLSGSIGAPATILIDTFVTVEHLTFNNPNTYAVSGVGVLALDSAGGDATVDVVSGNHKFQVDVVLGDNTSIDVASGATIEFNNELHLNGLTLTKTGAGELVINNEVVAGGGNFVCAGGTCTGAPLVAGSMASVGAVVSPGNGVGAIQVNGDFSMDEASTLLVEIGGTTALTGHDLLYVGGALEANGTLEVVLANGFSPNAGDEFDVLDFASIVGEFSLDLPDLAGNLIWDTAQLHSTGALSVTAVPEPASAATMLCGLLGFSVYRQRKGTRCS